MKNVVFLGGDRRELAVMQKMIESGWQVSAFALPQVALPAGADYAESPAQALAKADACILPLPPLHEDGRLHSLLDEPVYLADNIFESARPGMPIITGIVTAHLQCIAGRSVCVGLLDTEELALPLAEATAEGALAEAMRLSSGLLWGSSAVVIGFGRIGRALAWRLDALGVNVTVLNRSHGRAAEARDYGFEVGDWRHIASLSAQADFVFNTAPAPVLSRGVLQWLSKKTLILDLAAAPGGTDFEAARELGVKAVHAGGLPGRYSPQYSGEVMADAYLRRLEILLDEGDSYE